MEIDVIRIMRAHLEGKFPKTCTNCGRLFSTLREYLVITTPVGSAMPYDADINDWNPLDPIGTVNYANCPCHGTLALSSHGMPLFRLWSLMNWARRETKIRQQTPQELLNYLRDQITEQVLQESNQSKCLV